MIEADDMGCHIITAPADVLKKMPVIGTKIGAELSLDAVRLFREDAVAAGLSLVWRRNESGASLAIPARDHACDGIGGI